MIKRGFSIKEGSQDSSEGIVCERLLVSGSSGMLICCREPIAAFIGPTQKSFSPVHTEP